MIYWGLRVHGRRFDRRLDGRAPSSLFLHHRCIHGVQAMRILDAARLHWSAGDLRPEQSASNANR